MNSFIQFQFKGDRTYVHGSDIYNKVSTLLEDDEYISDISFRQVTDRNCYLRSAAEEAEKVVGIVRTNQRKYFLVESETTVSGRYAFDEEALVENANVESNVVTMEMHQSYTLIENIIAMTKKLSYAIDPEISGKWLFGQLKLDRPFPKAQRSIKIESTRRIPHRFSENTIIIDEIQYGTIMFIVGTP